MRVRYPITLTVIALNLAVVALPLYWWVYDFGGLLIIETSPFQFTASLLGTTLRISYLISAVLEAYRAYLIITMAQDLYLALRGMPRVSRALFTASLTYLAYPLIIYGVIDYVIRAYHLVANYEPVFIGVGSLSLSYDGASITMPITIAPHPIYWAALTAGFLAILLRKHPR
jgi:hypothetical protein